MQDAGFLSGFSEKGGSDIFWGPNSILGGGDDILRGALHMYLFVCTLHSTGEGGRAIAAAPTTPKTMLNSTKSLPQTDHKQLHFCGRDPFTQNIGDGMAVAIQHMLLLLLELENI